MTNIAKAQAESPNSKSGDSPKSSGGKKIHEGESDISGSLDIKIGVKSVKNIIDGGDKNEAKTRIGVVSQSGITGKLTIDLENLGDITNKVNGTNNKSYINIGTVENSKIGGSESIIKVKAKNITSEVLGGENNTADMRIGTVQNSHIKDKLDINVDVEGEIKNSITGGNDNNAIMKIGSIENTSLGEAIIKVKAKNITNSITGNGNNNTATMNVGTIANTNGAGKAKIDVDINGDIKNSISGGGSDNEALMQIGGVTNAKVSGQVDIIVKSQGDITNEITAGSKNKSEVTMGFVE